MLTARQHAAALRKRQGNVAPLVADLSDEDLLVRHYMHVATQGIFLSGDVAPHVEELHDEGLRLLTNRAWGLRKTGEDAVRKVVQLALKHNLTVETY